MFVWLAGALISLILIRLSILGTALLFLLYTMSASDQTTPAALKEELLELLAAEHINVLRVKLLCREYPWLISSAGLRVKVWTLFLLGISPDEESRKRQMPLPATDCMEQQVLMADVIRTRGDIDSFRTEEWRDTLRSMLQYFCVVHKIQYKQGMNEV